MKRLRIHSISLSRALSLTLALAAAAPANAVDEKPQPAPVPTEKVTLHPAAAPDPALKYRLIPTAWEMRPGNAASGIQRAIILLRQTDDASLRKREESLPKWNEGPLDALPLDQASEALKPLSEPLFELDRAAALRDCEWQLPIRERGFDMLLPEMGEARRLNRWLELRARCELAKGNYDAVTKTLRTQMALARHVSKQGTLISSLVGGAIESRAYAVVTAWINRRGSPNLYWALATVPANWVEFEAGFENERHGLEMFLKFDEEHGLPAVGDEEWKRAFDRMSRGLEMMRSAEGEKRPDLSGITLAALAFPKARKELAKRGASAADLDRMSTEEVILRYSLIAYRAESDEAFKWLGFPYAIAAPRFKEFERRLKEDPMGREVFPIVALTAPAIAQVRFSQVKVQRERALLQTLEAYRLHAAATGEWPRTSADVTLVPLPTDPVSGEPFLHTATPEGLTLEAPLLPSMTPTQGRRFDATFGPAKK